ncbi:MAG: HAMP domain-containing histidine kinase [Prolixibacteraceae bacterium]|nr:HAMP domain-containing histidine kinase [Prolixibacteraceae bacterium]
MDIYFKKKRWKQFLLLFAVLIGIGSLLYTNRLVSEVSNEERIKIEHWAEATRLLVTQPRINEEISTFLLQILSNNITIPLIIVDEEGEIMLDKNIRYNDKNREKVLKRNLGKMKAKQQPIEIPQCRDVQKDSDCEFQYLYYKESSLQTSLRFYPIFQLLMIVIFIIAAYVAFSSARKSEQNLVWIGMAKETAHQLGTPISSLIAWVELLRDEAVNPSILEELEKDTQRLEKITERFSKVGSQPELYPENIYALLQQSLEYLKKRISKKIEIKAHFEASRELYLPISSSLFSWVIENLIRNSVDAIEDQPGTIDVYVTEKEKEVHIEVVDNGKGLSKSKFKTIFEPGFTTKKRGWGLGLSLSKRIIENYHNGKIHLKSSEPRKATVFQIILKK